MYLAHDADASRPASVGQNVPSLWDVATLFVVNGKAAQGGGTQGMVNPGMALSVGYAVGSIVGIVAHEAAHVLVGRSMGLRLKRIGVTWRGLYVVRETGAPVTNAIVSAAGPLINLLLAAFAWRYSPSFALANLVLGLSNLIPTRNSDGTRVLRELRLARRPSLQRRITADPLPGISLRI
jgi:Zn-dependent protease